jgi:RNA polymerase sigma-70 factor (ECF subfamily)
MMPEEDEVRLLAGAREFDLEILAVIYDRYSPQVYRYAVRLLADEGLAEECVAETFSRLLHALRRGRGPHAYLRAYLYRVAHNWITDQYRRQPVTLADLDDDILSADPDGMPERWAEANASQAQMRRALSRLTADQRQVIALRFVEGITIEETAAALAKPPGAIKSLQYRALASLRRLLEESTDGTPYRSPVARPNPPDPA